VTPAEREKATTDVLGYLRLTLERLPDGALAAYRERLAALSDGERSVQAARIGVALVGKLDGGKLP
jgi:hypothetical protein